MSPQETDALRKEVKKLLIDRDLDRDGSLQLLADRLGVNARSLSMALTGYRSGPSAATLLERLRSALSSWPSGEAA